MIICATWHAFETISRLQIVSLFINFVFLEIKYLEEEIALSFHILLLLLHTINMNQ